MSSPEEKKGKPPGSKPGTGPGSKPQPEVAPEPEPSPGPGTITEVAPEPQQRGPIKEMSPDTGRVHPEVAPDVFGTKGSASAARKVQPEVAPYVGRSGGPIQEMAPETGRGVHPEVAPDLGSASHGPIMHPLYAQTIHHVVCEGNLQRMKEVASVAEQHLNQWGDLRAALEILKLEIAKMEHKHRRGASGA